MTNVKDGSVASGSKDAVNGGQLYTVDQKAIAAQTSITNITNGKAGLVQQSAAGAKLTVGKDTDGTQVDFANSRREWKTPRFAGRFLFLHAVEAIARRIRGVVRREGECRCVKGLGPGFRRDDEREPLPVSEESIAFEPLSLRRPKGVQGREGLG
ncbi:hypothetical protein P7B03_17440 [Lysobacter soli]|nr:hypothetical protein [Lysobacter soli]MDG2519600.1 hypothetical protein [Lysobacter soli]